MNKKEQTSLFILYHNVVSCNAIIQEWHPTRVFFSRNNGKSVITFKNANG